MSIEIANESDIDVDETALLSVSRFALDQMGVNPHAELSILIVDVDHMTELNEKWMDETGPTDVLSFPMDELTGTRRPGEGSEADEDDDDEETAILGDIVLCPAYARKQADAAGHPLIDELTMLTVHGVLHILGYDHMEPDEQREMFTIQDRILASWRADAA